MAHPGRAVMAAMIIPALAFSTCALTSCSSVQPRNHEVRAVWMSRYDYAAGKTPRQSRDYITAELERCRKAGVNTVIFQVRGQADALYRSTLEPWSDLLTGELGKDPGWDPLAFAIAAAHMRGMELHAWINVFPAWKAGAAPPPATVPLHPYLAHPEWIVCDGSGARMSPRDGYISFNPASPAVRAHVGAVVAEITGSYDIDGIHLDYIRYPDGASKYGYSRDRESLRLFSSPEGNPRGLAWDRWQMEQVNLTVAGLYRCATGIKPWVKVSAAVLGHASGTPWNGIQSVYQDARAWLEAGTVDMLFPMTYTSTRTISAPYGLAIDQWKCMLHYGRAIVPAVPAYKYGQKHYTMCEFNRQIGLIRDNAFQGVVFFSADGFAKIADRITARHFPAPALPAPMSWKQLDPPATPHPLFSKIENGYVILRWESDERPARYALYEAANDGRQGSLVEILPGYQTFCLVSKKQARKGLFVTAVNRAGAESCPVRLPRYFD